jgi:4'-phosphopantetheinyl transferase EntD
MVKSHFFPKDIFFYFTAERKSHSVLSEREWEHARNFGTKRLADFSTGRYCLRRCTGQMGFSGEILVGERGMPLLPDDISASVSHSKNLCGAIAGYKHKYQSVGLDIETRNRVHKGMWHLLFNPSEIELLDQMDEEQQNYTTTVFFSLKEAFYKLQFPLTGVFLDFHDAEIVIVDGNYFIKTMCEVADLFRKNQLIPGSVIELNEEVITYCVLE